MKHDKPPSLSPVINLQVGQAFTHIDLNGTQATAIITKVIICNIYGDTMYLIEGTPNQTQQSNIDYLREYSDPKLFLINSTIQPFHTNTSPKNL